MGLTGAFTDVEISGNMIEQPAAGTSPALDCGGTVWTRVKVLNNIFDASACTGGNNYAMKIGDLGSSVDLTVAGNTLIHPTSGGPGDALRITATGGVMANMKIHDNSFLNGGSYSVYMTGGEFRDNYCDGNVNVGGGGGFGAGGVVVHGNYVVLDAIFGVNLDDSVVSDNVVLGSAASGSNACTVRGTRISFTGNRIMHSASNGTAAVALIGCSYVDCSVNFVTHTVSAGKVIDEQSGGNNNWIHDNDFMSSTNPVVTKIGAATVVQRNKAWTTEAVGATSVANGGTITHGLSATPTKVRCTCSVSGEMVSVTALGSSTFTVAIIKNDGSGGTTQTIYWAAEV